MCLQAATTGDYASLLSAAPVIAVTASSTLEQVMVAQSEREEEATTEGDRVTGELAALAALEIRHPNPKIKHVLCKFIIFNPFHL